MTTVDALAQNLEKYNEAYRKGEPLVSDRDYDAFVEELRIIDPEHRYLKRVEPEKFDGKNRNKTSCSNAFDRKGIFVR